MGSCSSCSELKGIFQPAVSSLHIPHNPVPLFVCVLMSKLCRFQSKVSQSLSFLFSFSLLHSSHTVQAECTHFSFAFRSACRNTREEVQRQKKRVKKRERMKANALFPVIRINLLNFGTLIFSVARKAEKIAIFSHSLSLPPLRDAE